MISTVFDYSQLWFKFKMQCPGFSQLHKYIWYIVNSRNSCISIFFFSIFFVWMKCAYKHFHLTLKSKMFNSSGFFVLIFKYRAETNLLNLFRFVNSNIKVQQNKPYTFNCNEVKKNPYLCESILTIKKSVFQFVII